MSSTSEWSPFYQALNRIGPRLLHGVHRDLVEYVALEASDTDSFFSWGLHSAFWDWEQGKCEEAVERALNQWVCSVQQHLGEILGDDSLLPFEQLGITPSKRSELRVSTKRMRLRLDRDHIKTF